MMGRRLVGLMLVAAGIVFGIAVGHYGRMETTLAATQAQDADEQEDVAAQLKLIKTQVSDINTLLHSGTLRVVVVINPD